MSNTSFLTSILIVSAIFIVPVIPIGITYANELTFPLDETVIVGFTLMISYGFGFVLALVTLYFTSFG